MNHLSTVSIKQLRTKLIVKMFKKIINEGVTVFLFLSLALTLGFTSFRLFELIYLEQNAAFIDEIFHIPQAQLYCDNQWTKWNPKITTLPGLYLVSYVLLKPLEIMGVKNICSVYTLRLTNVVATVLNFFLSYFICGSLEKKYKVKPHRIKLLTAFNIAIFPPLYFFTFLYYTDVWSLTFVLLAYHSHLAKKKFLATFSCVMAVLMRQTNIIWVGLWIIDETWNVLTKNRLTPVQNCKFTINVFKTFFSEYLSFNKKSKSFTSLVTKIISRTYHYVIVCLLFVSFVMINGSVVLGDKKAHEATFHPMQNLYALDFIAFFGLPFFIPEALVMLKKPQNFFLIVFLLGVCASLSETNKLEHPYLLADNRHLAFYLWKKFFGHQVIRRILIPTYAFSAILLSKLLQKRCHLMFAVALSICTFLNLTPQYLFELRYFIIPFVMYRLQFKPNREVCLETVFFIFINALVLYLFINRTFVWPSEPDVKQRIIW